MSLTIFSAVAAAMASLAAVAIAVPLLWARDERGSALSRARALTLAAAIATGLPLAALGTYAWIGAPGVPSAPAALMTSPHPSGSGSGVGAGSDVRADRPEATAAGGSVGAAGSLEESIARLEQRLARDGGDAAAWELLAQSYEFQGRAADAERARRRELLPGRPSADASALIAQATNARRVRKYPEAIAAYEKLVASHAMTADLWADYADASGAARGQLGAASERLIQRALAIEPKHPKALWLLGSLQVQQGDYRSALATWEKLRTILPPDSPDARLVADNAAEARSKLSPGSDRDAPAPRPATPVAAGGTLVVRGEVALDPRTAAALVPGAVLYVFAKAAGEAGPPLAVLRKVPSRWPVEFALDDSLAMLPDRKLSAYRSVTIEARLSRDGSANPAASDPRVASSPLDPRSAGLVRLVLAPGAAP